MYWCFGNSSVAQSWKDLGVLCLFATFAHSCVIFPNRSITFSMSDKFLLVKSIYISHVNANAEIDIGNNRSLN